MPKQTTDVAGDPYAIDYTAIGESWTIAKGVTVYGNDVGVHSGFVNNTLKNNGSIDGNGAGVVFDANAATSAYVFKNGGKGSIHGGEAALAAVDFSGTASLDNKGDISGLGYGAYFSGGMINVSVNNTGTIAGALYGFSFSADDAGSGASVDNHGVIEGGLVGIAFMSNSPLTAVLHNHKGAEIKSAGSAVAAEAQLEFTNEGKVKGSVLTFDQADKVINKGKIDGGVSLGEGIDTFKNKGNAKAGLVDSGEGNDLVVLGKKADKLLFNSDLDALTNVDTVKKFATGQDKMYLNLDIFTELTPGTLAANQFHKGTAAGDADDRIIYDKASGALYYDPDGTGALAQVQFANLGAGTKLKASDFKAGYDVVGSPIVL